MIAPSALAALLDACLAALRARGADRVSTVVLIRAINEQQDPTWQKPMTDRRLARILRRLGARPRDVRFASGRVLKGYLLRDLERAAARLGGATAASQASPAAPRAAMAHATPRSLDKLRAHARRHGLSKPGLLALGIVYQHLVAFLEATDDWRGRAALSRDAANAQALETLATPNALAIVERIAGSPTPDAIAWAVEVLDEMAFGP